jgi:SAM-dependent methyltransferase
MRGGYRLFDPMLHPEWVNPHSEAWYAQLGSESGIYQYPWKSRFAGPTAEEIFMDKLSVNARNGKVLEIGCGHGEFVHRIASVAAEVTGIDTSETFIASAKAKFTAPHTRFMVVDGNAELPFADGSFDLAYAKKGPTRWFREANRVVKPGGAVAALYHAGSHGLIREVFPGLYHPAPYPKSSDILPELELTHSGLVEVRSELLVETEYLASAEDVLIKKCFGQNERLHDAVWEACLRDVEKIFDRYASPLGLQVTNCYYLVTARASS